MKKIDRFNKNITTFLYDHYKLKQLLHEAKGVFFGLLAAAIFAFGYSCFIAPHGDPNVTGAIAGQDYTTPYFHVITGGVSGLSQNLNLILKMCGVNLPHFIVEGIGYTCFNIPLLIFAFFAVGKRFSIQTAINVVATSLLISFVVPATGIPDAIAGHPWLMQYGAPLRLLFAGLCTGLSSAIAFRGELSCGGIDIITYYYAMRKSTSVGKYGTIINTCIITMYSILIVIDSYMTNGDPKFQDAVITILFSVVYLFVVALVVDMINLRNKKVQLEFITTNEHLGYALISNFPHGATIDKAKGVYSGTDRYIIWMVVSTLESNKVIKMARKVDPKCFITVTSLVQVYGKFFIKPIE